MGAATAERRVVRDGARGDNRGRTRRRTETEAVVPFAGATEVEIAWAAGLFEGEGSISIQKIKHYRYPHLNVTSTDLDVLEKFQRIIGCGYIRVHNNSNNPLHKGCYRFKLHRAKQVRDAFYTMYPHLGTRRRERGLEVLAECAKVKSSH